MGRIIEPEGEKPGPCRCYYSKEHDEYMCYKNGVLGTLSDSQEESLCSEKVTLEAPNTLTKQWEKMKKHGVIADVCMESEVDDYYACSDYILDQIEDKGLSPSEAKEKAKKKFL